MIKTYDKFIRYKVTFRIIYTTGLELKIVFAFFYLIRFLLVNRLIGKLVNL